MCRCMMSAKQVWEDYIQNVKPQLEQIIEDIKDVLPIGLDKHTLLPVWNKKIEKLALQKWDNLQKNIQTGNCTVFGKLNLTKRCNGIQEEIILHSEKGLHMVINQESLGHEYSLVTGAKFKIPQTDGGKVEVDLPRLLLPLKILKRDTDSKEEWEILYTTDSIGAVSGLSIKVMNVGENKEFVRRLLAHIKTDSRIKKTEEYIEELTESLKGKKAKIIETIEEYAKLLRWEGTDILFPPPDGTKLEVHRGYIKPLHQNVIEGFKDGHKAVIAGFEYEEDELTILLHTVELDFSGVQEFTVDRGKLYGYVIDKKYGKEFPFNLESTLKFRENKLVKNNQCPEEAIIFLPAMWEIDSNMKIYMHNENGWTIRKKREKEYEIAVTRRDNIQEVEILKCQGPEYRGVLVASETESTGTQSHHIEYRVSSIREIDSIEEEVTYILNQEKIARRLETLQPGVNRKQNLVI